MIKERSPTITLHKLRRLRGKFPDNADFGASVSEILDSVLLFWARDSSIPMRSGAWDEAEREILRDAFRQYPDAGKFTMDQSNRSFSYVGDYHSPDLAFDYAEKLLGRTRSQIRSMSRNMKLY